MSKKPLIEALLSGEDLMTILVSAGISCWTCKENPKHLGFKEGGHYCSKTKEIAACPEITVCLHWREGRTLEQIERFDADGEWKEAESAK